MRLLSLGRVINDSFVCVVNEFSILLLLLYFNNSFHLSVISNLAFLWLWVCYTLPIRDLQVKIKSVVTCLHGCSVLYYSSTKTYAHTKCPTCLAPATCSGETVSAGVSISALPTLEWSESPALHSNSNANLRVTSALRMGSKLDALLQERAVWTTVRMYNH